MKFPPPAWMVLTVFVAIAGCSPIKPATEMISDTAGPCTGSNLTTCEARLDEALAAVERGDIASALAQLRSLAERGYAPAQYSVGAIYAKGEGVPQNYQEAAIWYRRAAEQGYEFAQNNLGSMYDHGNGVPQDLQEALKWYRLAAAQSGPIARFNLGAMYHHGRGVQQDHAEAARLYRLSADQGYVPAQFNLATLYADGLGVPKNIDEARRWYRAAAEQGDLGARYNLGLLYEDDYDEAVKSFRQAASEGDARSQFMLGVMYYNGQGVAANDVVAYAIFSAIASTEDPALKAKAEKNCASMKGNMSQKNIAAAAALAKTLSTPSAFLNLPAQQ